MWAAMLAVLLTVGALGQAPDATLGKAAREGDLARLKSLLDSGVDPNRRDDNGSTALVEAAAGGHAAATRALVAAGANPNLPSSGGRTPLLEAGPGGPVPARAHPNLPSSGGRTPLLEAALGGRVEIARLLIAAGANVNLAEGRFEEW